MSTNSDDEIPHKRQRLSSDSLGEEDPLIAKCNECQIRDLDSITDGNTSERKFVIFFRINEEPPIQLGNLDTRTFLQLKRNDTFTEAYMRRLIADGRIKIPDDTIEAMWRSLDTVEFEPIELSTDEDITRQNGDQHRLRVIPQTDILETSVNLDQQIERLSQISIEKEFVPNPLEVECNKRACLDGKFFTVKMDTSAVDGAIYAQCNFCNPDNFIKVSLRCTSNATSHLKNIHPDEHENYQEYVRLKKKESRDRAVPRKRWSCTFSQEAFNLNVTNYILESMAPLCTVEKKSFRKIFDDFNIKKNDESLKQMTRYSLSMRITQTFNENIEEIRQIVASIEYVCTTADAWSGKNRRFLGVTLHWIEEKTYERKSAAIACKRFPGTHSHEAIARYLSEIHNSYNLTPEKIVATVTDNGSNFVKAFKEYGVDASDRFFFAETSVNVGDDDSAETHVVEDFSSDDSATEDANFSKECQRLPQHLRCASHTLHLVATTDSIKAIERSGELKEMHSRVLAKCVSLWKSLRSPKMNESLKKYLGSALRKPVVTRWNSLFDALQQLVTLKEKLLVCSSGNAEGISLRDTFTRSDFRYLQEYVTSTKPLAEAIDRLQGETNCHYGYLLPTLVSLRRELLLLRDNAEIRICQPLLVGMIESLEMRFKKMFEISDEGIAAAIAAVSHPKFKIRWLRCLSSSTQKRVYDHVIDAVSAESQSEIPSEPKVIEPNDEFDFGDGTSIFQDLETCVTHAAAEVQVTQYLKDPDTKLNMLRNYPVMQKLFRKFNTPLPSSAPVERLFSYATMMDLPKFNRLSDGHFEERVLGAANASKYFL